MDSNGCCVLDCESRNRLCYIENNRYCGKHYQQMKVYGRISIRTKYDINEIEIFDDYAKMYLYDARSNVIGFTIFDIEDIEKVSSSGKWGTNRKSQYVYNQSLDENKTVMIHHFLLGIRPHELENFVVDHINRDRRDNRKSNLRIVSLQKNAINKGMQSNNTSGYPGIHFNKTRKKWESAIKINGRKINLGRFDTFESAVEVRKLAEIKYFGEVINREYDCNTVFK